MNKKDIERLTKKLEARMAGIAKERDKLDEAISEFESLRKDCLEAYDDLQRARDALSRLV